MQDYESESRAKVAEIVGASRLDIGIDQVMEVVEMIALNFGIAVEEAAKMIVEAARSIAIVFENVKERVFSIGESLQEIHLRALDKELERKYNRELHKLDFTRPKIQHQVLCRKPKLVRKIIH